MRSLLRWLGRLVLAAVVVVVLVVGIALVTAHTGWGREQLRRRAEAALQAAFPGGARVGAVDGSILGTLIVRDVELDGRDHRPLVTVGRVEIAVALWPLAVQTAQIDRLVAEDVHVFVRREPGPAAVPQPPPPGAVPWRVELLHAELHRAAIEIEAAGTTQTLTDVDVLAGGTIGATGVALFGWSHAIWTQRSAELTAVAAITLGGGAATPGSDGGVRVPAALVSVGRAPGGERDPGGGAPAVLAMIAAARLAIDVDHPRGTLAVSAPERVVAMLLPELDLHGMIAGPRADLVATIELAQAAPAATRVEIVAGAGDTRLRASLHGDVAARTGQGVIEVTAVDLGQVMRGPFAGRDDATAAVELAADQVRVTVAVREQRAAEAAEALPAVPAAPAAEVVPAARATRAADDTYAALERARVALIAPALGSGGATLQATHEVEAALGLGSGGGAPWLAATGTVRWDGAALVLDDAHGVASAQAVVTAGQQIAGELAVVVRAAGSLFPVLDVRTTGALQGERVAVYAVAAAAAPCAKAAGACDRPIATLASVRGPFSLTVTSAAHAGEPPVIDVTGAVVAEAVAVEDVAIAVVDGSFSARAAAGAALGSAHLTAGGIRRAGSALGAAQLDVENRRDGTLFVAATAWPPAPGLAITSEAAVTPGPRTVARLGRTRVTLPGGATWAARGGSIVVDATDVHVQGVTLHGPAARSGTESTAGRTAGDGANSVPRADPSGTSAARTGPVTASIGGDPTVALRVDLSRKTGALVAHVEADRLTASAIDPRARGLARGVLELERRAGRWQADGRFDVTGLAVAPDTARAALAAQGRADGEPGGLGEPGPVVDGSAHVTLAGQRVTLDARATSPALGVIELAFEALAPRDPLDIEAWRRLDKGAIHNATITARRLELPGLVGVAGMASPPGYAITGTIDGAVNLAPAALGGTLAIRGIELPYGALEGDVTVTPHGGDLGVDATARLSGVAAADLTARFAIPEHPFDLTTWPVTSRPRSPRAVTWGHAGRDLLKEAAVKLDRVPFDPELLARLGVTRLLADHGVAAPYRGRATLQVSLGAAATEAALELELSDVIGGALAAPVGQRIAITASSSGTHVRAEARGGAAGHEVGLGTLEADLPMTTERWIDDPTAVLRMPLAGRWTLPVTPLVPVLAIVGRHDLSAGTIEGSAVIRGTPATPIVEPARLVARQLVVAPRLGARPLPGFADLELAAAWGGASGTITLTGHETTGGELRGIVNGRPDALAAATGTLVTHALDIAPIAALLPGRLASAAGVVDADLARGAAGQITGTLHITGGALLIAPVVGTLRDAAADLTIEDHAIRGTIFGKLGRGTVRLTAETAGDLTTTTAKLELRDVSALGSLRPIVSADLDARLRLDGGQVRGEVTVANAHVTLPEHPGTPLLDAGAPADLVLQGAPEAVAAPGPRAPLHPWLDVDVKLGATRFDAHDAVDAPGIDVDVLSAQGVLRSDGLRVKVGESLGVVGTVAIEDADADILGRRYRLDPSRLEFNGTIDPALHITMSHQFTEATLSVELHGHASQPELRFTSDSGRYSQDQLFGFFIGGEPGGDPGSQTGEAVAGAVIKGVSGGLGRRLGKLLPFKLDAVSCALATTSTSKSCTFGKRLSQRLVIYYSPHLAPLPSENANELQAEYRLGSKAVIDVTGGDREHYGADLLWRHRW